MTNFKKEMKELIDKYNIRLEELTFEEAFFLGGLSKLFEEIDNVEVMRIGCALSKKESGEVNQ